MRALTAILLLLASTASGQEAIARGDPAPADGVFLTPQVAAQLFKDCTEAKQNARDLERALVEKQVEIPLGKIALAGGLGVIVGVVTVLLVRR